jgi:glycosyltransferase involved in cell wall biosynthesis
MGSQSIVLISSGQPSLNPRLVKEADSLCDAGYDVTVLYAYWNDWGTTFDQQLIPLKKWKSVCIGGDPIKKNSTFLLTKAIHRAAKTINQATGGTLLADIAIARAAYSLKRNAKRYKADLYIAHNLGALPAAATAAKKYDKPCGFDAEDFHRNETSDDNNNLDVALKTRVEDQYLPQVSYFTTSSPQIAERYQQIYPQLKPVVLLNVFHNSKNKSRNANLAGPVKLFWFSQTIGTNRGIGDVVMALQLLKKIDFELNLLGKQLPGSESFIEEITNSGIAVKFHNPIHPDELTSFAAQFDIGLALEPAFSINNNIALSNKIFTYMQAGLAIIASDTAAQQDFINKKPTIGRIYPKGDAQALADILLNYQQHKEKLIATQNASLRSAHQQYNWDAESLKFLSAIKETLSQQNQ